jgi:GT2 family glycosyltransferase
MPPAARGAVAVVTVTYRSAADIGDFLDSLRTSGDLVGRVVVVDNPSDQSDETIALALAAGAEVVRLPENVGYGRAINA